MNKESENCKSVCHSRPNGDNQSVLIVQNSPIVIGSPKGDSPNVNSPNVNSPLEYRGVDHFQKCIDNFELLY